MVTTRRDDAGALIVELSWLRPRAAVLGALMLLAADVALVAAARYIVVVLQEWAAFIPLTLVFVLPLALFHYSALQSLRNRTTFRVTKAAIEVAWGPLGAGSRSVDVPSLQQIFATGRALGRATLWAHGADGSLATIAKSLPTDAAHAVERALEDELAIADRAVRSELPKGEALRRARRSELWRPVAGALVVFAVGTVGALYLTQPAIGGVVARVDVKAGYEEVPFEVDAQGPVAVSVRMSVAWDEALPNSSRLHLDELPRAFDLRVTVDEETIVCDPFQVESFEVQSTTAGITEMSVAWFGRLRRCRFDLAPGQHVLGARLDRLDDRVRVEQAEVFLRR